ncbi:hypothetical protein [Pseudomonas sivasensis]|uniref:hypothetical protein n=1 Tax=Pseudomonas sivasensis TaxID=1880678 RepID=UPI0030DD41D6
MKNPYVFGFYCSTIALIALACAVFFGAWSHTGRQGTQDAFAFVSSFSSLIQALAAAFVAFLAFRGLFAWKYQIVHEKYLEVVWDANVTLREMEGAYHDYLVPKMTQAPANVSKPDAISEIKQGELGNALKKLKSKCILLDKIVVKKEWLWQNYATALEAHIFEVALELNKPLRDKRQGLFGLFNSRNEESLQRGQLNVDNLIDQMSSQLDELEKKYSL